MLFHSLANSAAYRHRMLAAAYTCVINITVVPQYVVCLPIPGLTHFKA